MLLDWASKQVANDFSVYQVDPVAFGQAVLKDTFTPDVEALMRSVEEHQITIAKSANATGKTHAAARVAIWWYKAFPDSQVYTAAAPPVENLKNLLWGEIGSIVQKHPKLFEDDSVTYLNIARSPNSFLTGVTIPTSGDSKQREARFSGKHAPHLLFILDEGDAIPDEVYRGIESCMSGGHARLLIMFNPRSEGGAVYRLERDRLANVVHLSALNHPNVVEGRDIIPGAVTRAKTVERVQKWCRPLTPHEAQTGEDIFVPPSFLHGVLGNAPAYRIEEAAFHYMVMGQYPPQGSGQLISRAWIDAARSRFDAYVAQNGDNTPAGIEPIAGMDCADMGDDYNVLVFRYGGYVNNPIIWNNVDPVKSAEKAGWEANIRNCRQVNVDATGVGAGVAPMMIRQGQNAQRIMVASSPTFKTEFGEFRALRDQLWWAVREWLRTDQGAMLPPDEYLLEELRIPTYQILNGKIVIMPKDDMKEQLKRSPDRADALCLTFAP